MVPADRGAACVIDLERPRQADLERALLHLSGVDKEIASLLLRVTHSEADAIGLHRAGVADLAAGLAVERRLVDDHGTGFASFELGNFLAVAHQARDDALRGLGLVAEELGRTELLADREPRSRGGGLARA